MVTISLPRWGKSRVYREVNASTGQAWVRPSQMPGWMSLPIIAGILTVIFAIFLADSSERWWMVALSGAVLMTLPFVIHRSGKNARLRETLNEYERLRSTPEFQAFLQAGASAG